MGNSSISQIISKIENNESDVYRDIFDICSNYCVSRLKKKTDCTEDEAESVFIEAVLVFKNRVLENKLGGISSLKEYIFLNCWEIWRTRNHQLGDISWEERLKQAFFDMSSKKYGWNIQQEVARTQASYYSGIVSMTRQSLDDLSPQGFQILFLFYHQKRNFLQIADTMGLSGEEEARQLKSFYYDLWIQKIEPSLLSHA